MRFRSGFVIASIVVTGAVTGAALTAAPADAQTCPQTSSPSRWSGSVLETGTEIKDGVAYDQGGARLELERAAGLFRATPLGVPDITMYAAAADFDRDGWPDFVGVGETISFVRIYRNRTFDNPAPDWDDPAAVRTPRFVSVRDLATAAAVTRRRPTTAADFDGDGWPDVFRAEADLGQAPSVATLWLNKGNNDVDGNPQFKNGYNAMAGGTTPADLGIQTWTTTNIHAVDYNGDRKIDLLIGNGGSGGSIRIFLNNCTLASPLPSPLPATGPLPCATNPTFTYAGTLITNLGFGTTGNLPAFAYEDVDGDGRRDLLAGAPSCCASATQRLRLWKGLSGGGIDIAHPQSIPFDGGATAVLVADYSGDGRPDLIVATDNWQYNAGHGGDSFYWVNNGTATPFSDAPTQLTSTNNPTYDFDAAFVFDYDGDPHHTPDLMLADGNDTASFYVLANRVVDQYVACGEVASGTVDLGALSSSEMVVTSARLHPTYSLAGGSIAFFLSNEEPANWVEATDCGDASGDVCASFPKPVGRDVRWKAVMCASPNLTQTPSLTGIDVTFDYTEAREHFRSGVIVNDGVAYVGGFRQPGDRGHLFAVSAGLGQTYWDAADAIDAVADGSRHIYTATADGRARLDFTGAAATRAALLDTLGVADPAQAAAVVNWVRSARFGVGNLAIARSRLGAIETSTPAVLTAPAIPLWYVYASSVDRARYQAFQQQQADRRRLVLFGSKDGMIHAVHTDPSAIDSGPSGTEAWAFVPPRIASGMVADYTASLDGTTRIQSYPDGSPTLVDYRTASGAFATAALVSSGNGGRSLVALDVTRTVAPESGTILGPTPLWTAVPGGADAGQGHAKPAVARVRIDGGERYAVIAATGVAPDNPVAPWTKGRVVTAYDLASGDLLWQFQAACPVTSDITVFETDDELEPGDPRIDGYVDRVVFADGCGNVYKVDPGKHLAGGWNDNTGLGTIEVAVLDGARQHALFSTAASPGALGRPSPIGGTIGAKSDASTRLVLFFGTGGLESHAPTESNEFYALYADDGSIRSKLTGACSAGSCDKFYGGVVVTSDQVVLTRTRDPAIGTDACDPGSTTVEALRLDAAADGQFVPDFSQAVTAGVMGSLYGDAGAVYFATLAGDVARIGTPRAPTAGTDHDAPVFGTGGEPRPGIPGSIEPLTLMGWRQAL